MMKLNIYLLIMTGGTVRIEQLRAVKLGDAVSFLQKGPEFTGSSSIASTIQISNHHPLLDQSSR